MTIAASNCLCVKSNSTPSALLPHLETMTALVAMFWFHGRFQISYAEQRSIYTKVTASSRAGLTLASLQPLLRQQSASLVELKGMNQNAVGFFNHGSSVGPLLGLVSLKSPMFPKGLPHCVVFYPPFRMLIDNDGSVLMVDKADLVSQSAARDVFHRMFDKCTRVDLLKVYYIALN